MKLHFSFHFSSQLSRNSNITSILIPSRFIIRNPRLIRYNKQSFPIHPPCLFLYYPRHKNRRLLHTNRNIHTRNIRYTLTEQIFKINSLKENILLKNFNIFSPYSKLGVLQYKSLNKLLSKRRHRFRKLYLTYSYVLKSQILSPT